MLSTLFSQSRPTIDFAILAKGPGGKLEVVNRFRSTRAELPRFFDMNRAGEAVVRWVHFRELTIKEMVARKIAPDANAARKLRSSNYMATLISVADELAALAVKKAA